MPSLTIASFNTGHVPADESVVRRTAVPVEQDAPPAEQSSAPDKNEFESDSNPNLGMVTRSLASHVIPTQKYSPSWADNVDAVTDSTTIINGQVSSSGTAASREKNGQFGHGTMQVMEGIEPVADLVDGGKMSNQYFSAGKPDIQSVSGNYMNPPPGYDRAVVAGVSATGAVNARTASNASAYQALIDGTF